MHILILSQRNMAAQARMLTAAKRLAESFEIDPALAQALAPLDKDQAVRAMKEREAAADLLDAILLKVGTSDSPPVTVVTDEPPLPATVPDLPPPSDAVAPDAKSKRRAKSKSK